MTKGFTILETLMVIAILAVLATFVVMSFKNFNSAQALNKDAGLVVSVLNQARVLTLASRNNYQYGAHIATGQIVLFRGGSYSSSTTTNTTLSFNSGVSASTSLTGGGSDVIFERLTGKTSDNGTITLSLSGSTTTKSITIFSTGVVQAN